MVLATPASFKPELSAHRLEAVAQWLLEELYATEDDLYQTGFLEFAVDTEPARFCFVIDRGYGDGTGARVEFLGFTPSGVLVCRWVSDTVRVLRLEGQQTLPQPVEVAKPQVAPKRRDEGDATSEEVG